MNLSQETLLKLLNGENEKTPKLSPIQLAILYTNSALLVTVMEFLKEQLWLQDQADKRLGEDTSYNDFITPMFHCELSALDFMKKFLIESGPDNFKNIHRKSKLIEENALTLISSKSCDDQKEFLIHSLKNMTQLFIAEEKRQDQVLTGQGHQGPNLYRTFDNLDDIFELNYQLDRDMVVDHETNERLYQRAGVGVQSGYSTILLALESLSMSKGDTIIDLGSGYGRVGLVCSLLRPDVNFIGYEYVKHRVDISNTACEALGLEECLTFKTQDLSLVSFKIPKAQVYYLYDPFSQETYRYILNQILKVSQMMPITVVTKGNANHWLERMAKEHKWQEPVIIDEGNLCIYKSA